MKLKESVNIKSILFNNHTVKQTIFKNTFWLTVGMGADRLLKLILLIYAARILGATEYGKFNFALAFVSLFVVFHNFGLPRIVTREFSREERKEEVFSVFSLKILLSLMFLILILISTFLITGDPAVQRIIIILALFSLINSFITILYAFFQAKQQMEYQALGETLQALLVIGFGFFALFKFPSIENLSYSYLLGAFIALIVVLFFFYFKISPLRIRWDKKVWHKFFKMSWPLALTGLFGALFSNIDSAMMGFWGMHAETGWYNAAYRIIFVVIIPMGLISGSFYPVLSKFFKESKEKIQRIWDYQMELMILFAIPLIVGGITLAPQIISYFYPSGFSASILAFQILAFTAGGIFLYRPFYDILIASNQQKKIFWITLSGAIINIIFNLILIPKYSLYGAAVATVITYFLVIMVSLIFTIKYTPVSPFRLNFLSVFILGTIASFSMYFIIIQPQIYNLNIFISLLVGILTYSISVLVIKETNKLFKKLSFK